eukprot:Selendium_serpulae@DN6214_c0_g1_i1.p2
MSRAERAPRCKGRFRRKSRRKKLAAQDALLKSLFGGVENMKKQDAPPPGTFDPKQSRADQKINLYSDQREMDGWDQDKLEEVIQQRHGTNNSGLNETAKVCKYFLEAVEKKQYGWFWTCPNGEKCIYKHCLPFGYVLKRDIPEAEAESEEPIEEQIERERAALPAGGTPVTEDSFKKWKIRKEEERLAAIEAERLKAAKKTGGKGLEVLTGKDLFTFDPSMFVDDLGAADECDYDEEIEEAGGEDSANDKEATSDQPENSGDAQASEAAGEGPSNEAKSTLEGIVEEAETDEPKISDVDVQRKDLFLDDMAMPNDDELDDLEDGK